MKRCIGHASAPSPAAPAARAPLSATEQALFEQLRAHRRALAENQGVPPYVIFHDLALETMARDHPRSRQEFALVPGVGEKKLVRYADSFLAVIAEYLRQADHADSSSP